MALFIYHGAPETNEDLLKSTFDSLCGKTNATTENLISAVEDNLHVENQG